MKKNFNIRCATLTVLRRALQSVLERKEPIIYKKIPLNIMTCEDIRSRDGSFFIGVDYEI